MINSQVQYSLSVPMIAYIFIEYFHYNKGIGDGQRKGRIEREGKLDPSTFQTELSDAPAGCLEAYTVLTASMLLPLLNISFLFRHAYD